MRQSDWEPWGKGYLHLSVRFSSATADMVVAQATHIPASIYSSLYLYHLSSDMYLLLAILDGHSVLSLLLSVLYNSLEHMFCESDHALKIQIIHMARIWIHAAEGNACCLCCDRLQAHCFFLVTEPLLMLYQVSTCTE